MCPCGSLRAWTALVEFDAAGNRTWLTADERGSIIARSDDNANVIQIDKYDEYGKPQPGNSGRFQYTGQAWLDDLGTSPASGQGLYDYKSRMYAPHVGRFMQPDPIGYAGGLNLYAYVLNDPVNLVDPFGLQAAPPGKGPTITVTLPSCGTGIRGHDANGYFCLILTDTGTASVVRLPNPVASVTRAVGGTGGTPQRTQRPSPCQQAFLKDQLASRGLPTSQIDNLKFVSGLNGDANFFTRRAFNGGAIAVTQGSTVYVQPGRFNEVANFRSAIPFEEAYHTSQFASDGGFYSTYGILSIGGLLSMGDSYHGNVYEAFAQGASHQMFEASKTQMCPR